MYTTKYFYQIILILFINIANIPFSSSDEVNCYRNLDGIVVDKESKPVANAFISIVGLNPSHFGFQMNTTTDPEGKFSIEIESWRKLEIRANTESAVSLPVIITVSETSKTIKIVADKTITTSLLGVVTNENSEPLHNSEILVYAYNWHLNNTTERQTKKAKTDNRGKFQIDGLWPSKKYAIVISAPKYEQYGPKLFETTASGIYSYEKVILSNNDRIVKGKVVDSAGTPLSNTRVFNVGDGLVAMETKTNATGNFILKGFRKGTVFVFAEKEGYWFTGIPIESDASDNVIKMYRKKELPPQYLYNKLSASCEEDEKRATHLLNSIWPTAANASIIQRMMLLDPNKAQEWANATKIQIDPHWGVSLDVKIAEKDIGKALALIRKDTRNNVVILSNLAKYFAKINPQKALLCIEEANAQLRNAMEPKRAFYLSQLGAIATWAGHKEIGQKLTAEALGSLDKWKNNDGKDYPIGEIAVAVGVNDLPKALSMLEKITETNRKSYYFAQMAANLDDIREADKLFNKAASWHADPVRWPRIDGLRRGRDFHAATTGAFSVSCLLWISCLISYSSGET